MPRSRNVPHLERREFGYVWRRRLPQSLMRRSTESPGSIPFKSVRNQNLSDSENPTFSSKISENPTGCVKKNAHSARNSIQTRGKALAFSLKTDSFAFASAQSLRLTSISDQAFHYAAVEMSITENQVTKLLATLFRFDIEASDILRARGMNRTPEAIRFEVSRLEAVQSTLCGAFSDPSGEIARAPLKEVARKLGIELPESNGDDWRVLAHRAIEVMINACKEVQLRERGASHIPCKYSQIGMQQLSNGGAPVVAENAGYAALGAPVEASLIGDQSISEQIRQAENWMRASPLGRSSDWQQKNGTEEGFGQPALPNDISLPEARESTQTSSEKVNAVPASDPKEGALTGEIELNALETAKKRGLLINCSEETLSSFKKGSRMTVREAFDIYFDLKKCGLGEKWEKAQKAHKAVGQKWESSTLPNMKVAKAIWVDLLSDRALSEIREDDVLAAIPVIRDLPKNHGKSPALMPKAGYRELIERVQKADDLRMDRRQDELERSGQKDPTVIEAARFKEATPTLRAETYFKHVRAINRVGKMLFKINILSENVFEMCSFTAAEEDRIRAMEKTMARQRWDDRILDLWGSPVFHGSAVGPRDALFWTPLMAYLMGMRSEEILQLKPEDFGYEKGMPYAEVTNSDGNSVKSTAGQRKIQVHPALVELGLMELVQAGLENGYARLFDNISRGKTKKTFSENFTKKFTHYRQLNGVYWHGLDLHALRTTFHHELRDNATPGYIKRVLMGHEPLDEGERSYSQSGINMATLSEHVSAVPIDISSVVSPIAGVEMRRRTSSAREPTLKLVK